MSKPECAFCGIVDGTVYTEKIFEGNYNIAVIAKPPTLLGHTIVFPKRHIINYSELNPEERVEFGQIWGLVEIALITLLKKPRIVNLKSGGFEPHLHQHIYPVNEDASWEDIKNIFENKLVSDHDPNERQNLLLQLIEHLKHETDRNHT